MLGDRRDEGARYLLGTFVPSAVIEKSLRINEFAAGPRRERDAARPSVGPCVPKTNAARGRALSSVA